MKLYVESWAPEYGASVELADDDALGLGEATIDPTVEVSGSWGPIVPAAEAASVPPEVAFVDGVRRVDARLTLDDPATGPVPGLAGSYGVGAVRWKPRDRRSAVDPAIVDRVVVIADGRETAVPTAPPLSYRSVAVPGRDPAELVRAFHQAMRRAEADLAADLAASGVWVIADGPVNDLQPHDVVGYVKSHRVHYLEADHRAVIGELPAGGRTPVFALTTGGFHRYSWYLRIGTVPGGHSWSGVVRCEVAAALGLERAVAAADTTARLLPRVAAPLHTDPRAPQNLVPIAALERDLRRRLGDPGLVLRALRAAIGRAA